MFFIFLSASFPHAYSNDISMFLKYENVVEYRAGVGFHFVKMISYLTKSDTHMFEQSICFENIDKKSHDKFLLHFSSLSTQWKLDLCKYSLYMHIRILWKISNNQYSRWNQQRLSPGRLVGDKLFSSHTGHHMGQWGLGMGLFMNIHSKEVEDMTWGGASGVLRWTIIFWAIPKFSHPQLCAMDSSSSRNAEFNKIHI